MGLRPSVWWFIAYVALTLFFAAAVATDLNNFPPVSSDEVWIMSVSEKLANEAVLGSDMFAGLQGTDRHYFMNLPVQHFLQAIIFRLVSPGVAEARAVSAILAIALVWMVGWLAYRWIGLAYSVTTGVLLVFWRSNITASDPWPPLLALAQSARYDVTVLTLWWLTFVLLARHLSRPGRSTALALGFVAGVTALTQFFGIGIVAAVAAAWLWSRRDNRQAFNYWPVAVIACLVPLLLYGAYVARHWTDFVGQQVMLRPERIRFYSPEFYASNLLNEWRRFEWRVPFGSSLLSRGTVVGSWSVLVSLVLAAIVAAHAWRRGQPLIGLTVIAPVLSLAALDSTKAPIYGSLLVPTLSMGLAAAIVPSVLAQPGPYVRRIWAVAGAAFLAWVVGHGLEGYRFVAREAPLVSPYGEVGRRLEGYLVPDAEVLGSQRWWWALRDHDYRSLNGVWQRWIVERRAGHQPQFVEELSPGSVYLILDNDIRADLGRTPTDLQDQVRRVLANDADRVAAIDDRTYGIIEVYRLTR